MAKVRPGSIQRVNKLNSPIAHLDNIRSFLQACRVHFLLNDAQLFDVTDLQDPEQRSGAFTSVGTKGWGAEKRLKNVCVTLYWIGRRLAEEENYKGPIPDLSVFHPVLPGQTVIFVCNCVNIIFTPRIDLSPHPRGTRGGRGVQSPQESCDGSSRPLPT